MPERAPIVIPSRVFSFFLSKLVDGPSKQQRVDLLAYIQLSRRKYGLSFITNQAAPLIADP